MVEVSLLNVLGDIRGVVLVILVFIITWYLWQRLTTTLPPGPTPLPLIGNSLLTRFTSLQMYEYFEKISPKFGKIMTFYFGPQPVVVLNNFQAMKDAYVLQANDFAGRPWTMAGEIGTDGHSDIALADFGTEWSVRRRLAMVALKKFADKNTVSHLVCESTSDTCETMAEETVKCGKASDVKNKMYLMMYNIIACIVFGKKFALNDKDFKMLTSNSMEVNKIFGDGFVADIIPILRHIPTPRMVKFKNLMQKTFNYFDKQIAEHQATLDESNPRDITDAVLIARAQMEREQTEGIESFNNRQQRGILQDVFFAGTDTTAFTIHWAILYSMVYPDLQEKVYAEIDANIGTRMVVPDDRHKLPYTEAFLLEVMRIRPIVPLALARCTTTTTDIYGYTLPKGTLVISNIWASHHDPAYWANPDQFIPERFIDPTSNKALQKPDGFVSFSIGRRSCAGEHLARVDTFLIFATLIQKVKFSVPDGDPLPDTKPGQSSGAFFCVPEPYDLKAVRR